jgi:RNA polymerase sigma-70 factor, ECF subfamily
MEPVQRDPDEDDGLLLAALREGQAHAFERVMRRYNRLLFRAARGILHDDAEAQDAVQEAWLRAFLALDSFRGECALPTWLTRIAIHQALDRQRKLGRLVLWDEDPSTEENDMPTRMHRDAADTALSPEDELARQQVRRQLQEAIDLLPPIYRVVFILRAVHGLSIDETAVAVQVSHDVVKTRYLRARALLREQLDFDPETEAGYLHDFAGERCDAAVADVLVRLRAEGVIRDQ